MINNMGLLHYLSENTYKNICHALNLDDSNSKTKDNFAAYSDKPILRIHPFNILYKQFGHIWFLSIYINFPKFKCNYEGFEKRLFEEYEKAFGKKAMKDFPFYGQIICDYVEFLHTISVSNADDIAKSARALGCLPVKRILDLNDLTNEKKPHGKIDLSLSKKDSQHIETLVCCFGTGLKKRIKDKAFHGPVGIKVSKAVNMQTEKDIVEWTFKRNNFEFTMPDELF